MPHCAIDIPVEGGAIDPTLHLPENEQVLMLLDLGHAAPDAGPLPNHTSRKPLAETVKYL